MQEAELAITTTVAARTAVVLRQRILALQPGFRPGDRLLPLALADELGVSATPVREALERLAAEGLVESIARRGTYVAQLSTDDLDDLATVRGGLELLAFRFRGGELSTGELAALAECLDGCERGTAANDNELYRTNEAQFHRLLVAVGRSRRLLALCELLLKHAQIAEVYYPRLPEDMRASVAEHRRLLGVLSQCNLVRSEAELVGHWNHTRARVRQQFGDLLRTEHAQPSQAAHSAASAASDVRDGTSSNGRA